MVKADPEEQALSTRMLAWFAELSKRAEAVLFKPLEPLTDRERKMLGILHESLR